MKKKTFLGLYDSGIGGLTVLKEIRRVYPGISFHYLADRSNLPLGNKTTEEIQEKVKKGVELLFSKDCSLVLLVCNTASVVAARYLQQKWLTKIKGKNLLGISWPLIELMEEEHKNLKNKNGLILVTKAAFNNGFYQQELTRRRFKVKSLATTELASGIEKKSTELIKKALGKIKKDLGNENSEIDYVILACTHYPLIISQIRKYFKPKTLFIDPSRFTALKLKNYLKRHPGFAIDTETAQASFLTT